MESNNKKFRFWFLLLIVLFIFTIFAFTVWGPYTDDELRRSTESSYNISRSQLNWSSLYSDAELEGSAVFHIRNKEPSYSSEYLTKTYTWKYNGHTFTTTIQVPKGHYEYYQNESHTRNYSTYALTAYDREILNSMIDGFKQQGNQYGFSKEQNVMNIIAFVQSLPYTSDSVTTGYDNYPRYPIETLIDGGGDCEDTAILAAALLTELGYGTILISPPNHMALGIMGSENITGTYYEHNGSRYYYMETTATGWDLGELPGDYVGKTVKLYPISKKPGVTAEFEAEQKKVGSDSLFTYYKVRFLVENSGPAVANNVSIYLVAEADPLDGSKLWSPGHTINVGQMPVNSSIGEAILRIPHGKSTKFTIRVCGDYFSTEKSTEIFKVSSPELNATMNLERLNRLDFKYSYYKVRCNIVNSGDAPTTFTYVNITAETAPFDNTRVWSPKHNNIQVGQIVENGNGWAEAIVKIPKGETVKITCEGYGLYLGGDKSSFEVSSYIEA
ncbi:hypothetical protein MmiHf6_04510 [Methanimicrococcus hongohii]|uniref:Transglutaminase-like domain-containing protein n=1 Tax=Methanimicrococcus hongohii TaxID=3028295 RepID=A0AA96V192_9EURY|nr:hypothetical protein [Methanimicrococcus sp. Hf6]WNY23148.1 hypothetical protein MmiHf6_04510 [Methanimicrococcus sp. Hf6]